MLKMDLVLLNHYVTVVVMVTFPYWINTVHGGWRNGSWESYVHFHGIDTPGTLIDESDQWTRQGEKRKQGSEKTSSHSLDFKMIECLRLRGGGGSEDDTPTLSIDSLNENSTKEIVPDNILQKLTSHKY